MAQNSQQMDERLDVVRAQVDMDLPGRRDDDL